jgi:hypothetical protein
MDAFLFEDLKRIIEKKGVCISLYMPMHRTGAEVREDPAKLRKLLKQAEQTLAHSGVRDLDIREFLSPVEELENDLFFWRAGNVGLAVFLAKDFFEKYRLPLEFKDLVIVNDRFHVNSLLPLFTGDGRFYVLACSQKMVRLFQGSRYAVSEIEISGMPHDIADVMQYEDTTQKERVYHNRPNIGEYKTASHSQVEEMNDVDHLHRFAQAIDKSIHPIFRNERTPLIFAGVERLHSIYREANTYPFLMEEGIFGNPDQFSEKEIHTQAWKIVEPFFRQEQSKAVERYMNNKNMGYTSNNLEEITIAASEGRVDTLFIDNSSHAWGVFDPLKRAIQIHDKEYPGNEDLLNLAAINTLRNKGAVYATPKENIPEKSIIAAIFRY